MSEIKRFFRKDGFKVVEVDLSQIEIVVQAVLSGDPVLLHDLEEGIDFHCMRLAQKIGMPYDDVVYKCSWDSRFKEERRKSKEYSFQRAYGASATSIAKKTGMSLSEVNKFIKADAARYPVLTQWKKDQLALANRGIWGSDKRFIQSFSKYYVFDRSKDGTASYTQVLNYPVQGGAADIIKEVLGRLFTYLINLPDDHVLKYFDNITLNMTVHDCVIAFVAGDVLDDYINIIRKIFGGIPYYMKKRYGLDIPIPVRYTIEVGNDWLNVVELREIEEEYGDPNRSS